jgi:outer membrane lipoprotein-sorting protein
MPDLDIKSNNLKYNVMRKSSFFFLALFALSGLQFAAAQTLDEILKNHFRASGQDKLSTVNSVISAGRAMQMGMELPFLHIQKRPDNMYLEIDIQETKIIQVYDGKNGWSLEPWVSSEARELYGPELQNLGLMARIDSDLVGWEEKGDLLEYIGKEIYEGNDMFLLKLVKMTGESYQFFIDADTYLISRLVAHTNYGGNIVEGETLLGDYRKIHGVSLPFKTEIRYDGQTLMTNILENVEFDMEIDEHFFSKP